VQAAEAGDAPDQIAPVLGGGFDDDRDVSHEGMGKPGVPA
jgi:hypothetical protein